MLKRPEVSLNVASPPMRSRRRARIIVGALVLVLAAWTLPSVAGFSLALVDQARGRLALKRYGEPVPGQHTFHRLMRDRYGVTIDETGCSVAPGEIDFIRAYNWYAERRLRSRFGRDVRDECEREAALAAPAAPK